MIPRLRIRLRNSGYLELVDKEKANLWHRKNPSGNRKAVIKYLTKLRNIALISVGRDNCLNCNSKFHLCFAHIYYDVDSITDNQYHKRLKEAIRHPYRFNILCCVCHPKHDFTGKKKE